MPSRLEALKKLWTSTEQMSPTASEQLSPKMRKELDAELRQWFYKNGNGIFLSIKAADAFLKARKILTDKLTTFEEVHKAFSRVRTQLKIDLGVYSPDEAKYQIGIPVDYKKAPETNSSV